MQITFTYKTFEINISSHGYYTIYTNKMPTWKWSKIGGILGGGEVNELGNVKYLPENDDLDKDLEELKTPAIEFLKKNEKKLKKLEAIELKKWKDKQGKKVGGEEFSIGDIVRFENEDRKFKLLGYDKNTNSLDGQYLNGDIWATGINGRKIIKVNND